MKTVLRFSVIAILTLLVLAPGNAQFKTQGWGGGIMYGWDVGNTSLKDDHLRFHARAYLRHGIINHIQGEVGAGIGHITGSGSTSISKYETELIPADVRLLFNPFTWESAVPYVFGGVGVLHKRIIDLPYEAPDNAKFDEWVGYAPGGAGLMVNLQNQVYLDLNAVYNHTLTKKLIGVNSKHEDGFMSFLVGLTVSFDRGNLDSDGDGLTNKQEEELGTNPDLADTDGDGVTDGDEVTKYHTAPLKADTDGDGLSDGDEVMKYHTDPLKADTDGDGLSDGDEVNKYHTDPAKADTDGDGVTDGDEVTKYKTDPLKADTDGDGLSDGDEIMKYHTDPLKADTDGDGLSDGDEVTKYKTDPLKADTDGGSVSDGAEVARGTNPLVAADDVAPKKEELKKVEVGSAIVLEGVVFKTGKSVISPESEPIIEKAFNTLQQNPELEVEIRGYTDNVGKASSNMKLSDARAKAVRDYLIKKGIDAKRITAKGYGPENPIAPNTTAEGRAQNRRIEFFRTK